MVDPGTKLNKENKNTSDFKQFCMAYLRAGTLSVTQQILSLTAPSTYKHKFQLQRPSCSNHGTCTTSALPPR